MKNNHKQFLSITPNTGTGVEVVDGDLRYALMQFKRLVKRSNKLTEVHERREFVKPSVARRLILERAMNKK